MTVAATSAEHDPLVPSQPGGAASGDRTRGRLRLVMAALAVLVIAVDQLTKVWAVQALQGREPISVIDPLLQLRLVRNPGAAFSILVSATWIVTIVVVIVIIGILVVSRRLGSTGWSVALGLLLGGAIGNLIDRLVRAPGFGHGHVIDFLELPNWPVFNVADCSVCTAAALIALLGLRGVPLAGREPVGDESESADDPPARRPVV